MEMNEITLRSTRANLIFLIFTPLISAFGLFLLIMRFRDDPPFEIKLIFSSVFIIVGIGLSIFIIMRNANKLRVNENQLSLSRLFGTESIDWFIVKKIKLKFTGKTRLRRSFLDFFLFDYENRGTVEVEVNTDRFTKIKFTNIHYEQLSKFVESVSQLKNITPRFTDTDKRLWKECFWEFHFSS
ncbi:MAG: hypothetical protein ACFFAU_16975 [Candidatus Hodarchaeota archaeon]